MRCDPVVVFGFSGDNNVLLVEMRICRSTVNHWGTILSKTEIPMTEGGSYYPREDMNYLGETLTVEEYMRLDMRQDGVQEENGQDRMQMEL